jgi:Fur family peroxide stress response transcriptional regulator
VKGSELQPRVDHFREVCRKAGVKLTHQRLVIFREVAANNEHPTAEAVFHGVRRQLPTVSLDTVYRTLWLLSDLGLIDTLRPRQEPVRFDANVEPHHHYLCVQCGLATDFRSPGFDALVVPEMVKELGTVVTTRVEVKGLCSRCGKMSGSDE